MAVVAFSLCIGYFVGIGASLPFSRSSEIHGTPSDKQNAERDSEDEAEDQENGDLSVLSAKSQEECKLVSPVRAS